MCEFSTDKRNYHLWFKQATCVHITQNCHTKEWPLLPIRASLYAVYELPKVFLQTQILKSNFKTPPRHHVWGLRQARGQNSIQKIHSMGRLTHERRAKDLLAEKKIFASTTSKWKNIIKIAILPLLHLHFINW